MAGKRTRGRRERLVGSYLDHAGRPHRIVILGRLVVDLCGRRPAVLIAELSSDEGLEQARAAVLGGEFDVGYLARARAGEAGLGRRLSAEELQRARVDTSRGEDSPDQGEDQSGGVRARIGAPELRRPVQVVDRHGSIEPQTLSPDGHVALYCELVLRGQQGLIELVLGYRNGNGELRMRSRRQPANYLPADGCGALVRAAARARGRGEELFVTPLPREAAEPGKSAVRAGSVVWVDLDGEPQGSELGRMAALRAHLTVRSGGGLHC